MRTFLASLLLSIGLIAHAAVRVETGGVGVDERDALERNPAFNVKVIAVMQGGEYLADVDVTIHDARGTPVVRARTNGPWLMAELPPGRYRLVADFSGVSQIRDFTVSGPARHEIILRWHVGDLSATTPISPIR